MPITENCLSTGPSKRVKYNPTDRLSVRRNCTKFASAILTANLDTRLFPRDRNSLERVEPIELIVPNPRPRIFLSLVARN